MKSYDDVVKSIRKRNENLIYNFTGWMKRSGLAEKTIAKHTSNIDFFLNEYLVYQDKNDSEEYIELCQAEDGIELVDDFLDYWFIKKAMWSSENSIKENIASIKKFYTFMQSLNLISKEDLKMLNDIIKENKKEWIDTVNRYNNMDEDSSWN